MLADSKNDDTCEGLKCCKIAEDALALLKEQEDLGTELTNAVELIHKKNERIEKLMKDKGKAEPELEGGGSTWWYVCSECHGAIDKRDAYCKHCGAILEGW